MYNIEYLERPYVVVLNKIDLPEVCPYAASILCFHTFFLSEYLHVFIQNAHILASIYILFFQGRDRLQSLTEEILRIGCDEVPSEPKMTSKDAVHSFSTEAGNADKLPSQMANEDKKDKELEDYPRPLAVVGVSVL